jgi:hypothetical protein
LNLSPLGSTNTHEGHHGPHQSQRETTMTIKSKITAALAVVTLAGGLAIPTSSAQAGHHGGWGIGAGIVGAAIVGSAIAANAAPYGGYYVDGYRRCGWERQYNSFGDYVGTVKVCRIY